MSAAGDSQTELQPAGSPDEGEPVFLAVGRLRRPHGVQGVLVLLLYTFSPAGLRSGRRVYAGENRQALYIRRSRPHDEGRLISFEGCETPEAAGELRNQTVWVRTDEVPPLEEGEYYHHQVIGLRAVTEDGEALGRVAEILETGASDVYVVRGGSAGELLVPAVDAFILGVDLKAREIRVRLIPGMRNSEP
jgi:16S rRNA processing protein RimM